MLEQYFQKYLSVFIKVQSELIHKSKPYGVVGNLFNSLKSNLKD